VLLQAQESLSAGRCNIKTFCTVFSGRHYGGHWYLKMQCAVGCTATGFFSFSCALKFVVASASKGRREVIIGDKDVRRNVLSSKMEKTFGEKTEISLL